MDTNKIIPKEVMEQIKSEYPTGINEAMVLHPDKTYEQYVKITDANVNKQIGALFGYELAIPKWIPLSEETKPEDGQDVLFIVNSNDPWYHGRVLGGKFSYKPHMKYDQMGFTVPGIEFAASHWMAAPKSIVPPLPPHTT